MERERILRGVESVTLLQAYLVVRRSAALIGEVEAKISRLEAELGDAIDRVRAIEDERDQHVRRLVGYVNAAGSPALPLDLEQLQREGDEDELRVTWTEAEPEPEPEQAAPEALEV